MSERDNGYHSINVSDSEDSTASCWRQGSCESSANLPDYMAPSLREFVVVKQSKCICVSVLEFTNKSCLT